MYEFKQAVKINFKSEGQSLSQTFIRGRHHVSPQIEESDDFLHFVKCGWIAEVDQATAPIALETFSERSQRLAKRLAEKKVSTEPVREPVQETEEEIGDEVPEETLTPAQKAARTRKANKAKAEKGE